MSGPPPLIPGSSAPLPRAAQALPVVPTTRSQFQSTNAAYCEADCRLNNRVTILPRIPPPSASAAKATDSLWICTKGGFQPGQQGNNVVYSAPTARTAISTSPHAIVEERWALARLRLTAAAENVGNRFFIPMLRRNLPELPLLNGGPGLAKFIHLLQDLTANLERVGCSAAAQRIQARLLYLRAAVNHLVGLRSCSRAVGSMPASPRDLARAEHAVVAAIDHLGEALLAVSLGNYA